MKDEYHWDRINRGTKLAGVIGHPVGHSLSPAMHNRAYRHMGIGALYLKFDVADTYEAFARFINEFRARPWLDVMGLSVTIPHKSHALDYLRQLGAPIDPLAARIGAVNTLVFTAEGLIKGYNTDYLGVLRTLQAAAGLEAGDLKGKRVAVLGSGGVSRAIVAALIPAGASVTLFNRTQARARALAGEFHCRWAPWDERNAFAADVVINGTSLGMHPNVEDCPLDPEALRPGMIVFDTVYNPLTTRLLKHARQAGATAVQGADMLVYQAVEQIRLWLEGQQMKDFSIPSDIMKKAVLSRLEN
jgi:3-dehydroquinate dehydratase / shikimate dehydrogenase